MLCRPRPHQPVLGHVQRALQVLSRDPRRFRTLNRANDRAHASAESFAVEPGHEADEVCDFDHQQPRSQRQLASHDSL